MKLLRSHQFFGVLHIGERDTDAPMRLYIKLDVIRYSRCYFQCFLFSLAMSVLVNCSQELPEIEIGKIDTFVTPEHSFKVRVKNIDLGWYVGILSEEEEIGKNLLNSKVKISVENTSKTSMTTSFRQQYNEIAPGKSVLIYEGLFSDFWDNGGAMIIHSFEDELKYTLKIECSQSFELTKPIRIYLYTRDAKIFR